MLAFALFAAVLTVTPGLDTVLVIRTAAVSGRWPALAAAAGIGLGCLCWATASALGITALLTASHVAYAVLRWAGAAYLVWLGARTLWRALRSRWRPVEAGEETAPPALAPAASAPGVPAPGVPERGSRRGAVAAFRVGLTTNLLNPKIGVFYLSVLPQFLPAHANPLGYSLVLALIHDLEGLVWFAVLILLVGRVAAWLSRPAVRRRMEYLTAAVFLGFGLRLAVERAPG